MKRAILTIFALLLIPYLSWSAGIPAGALGRQGSYDMFDEFSDTLSAGNVNGTLSTSGHLRTVVDTENKLTITGGN